MSAFEMLAFFRFIRFCNEGAKVYNDFYYNGQKTQLRENMSYADFLDYWIDNYASFNLHYSTTISYINIIKNHVKPRVGFYKLWQLDTRLLQEFINKKINTFI